MSEEVKQALKFAEDNGIDACEYCKYDSDCKRGVTPDGNGNPCYPLCADSEPDLWVDEDALHECVKEYKQEENNA